MLSVDDESGTTTGFARRLLVRALSAVVGSLIVLFLVAMLQTSKASAVGLPPITAPVEELLGSGGAGNSSNASDEGALDEVTDAVAPIADPIVEPVVDAVAPILDPVVEPVVDAVAPILDPVVEPVVDAVAPIVAPVTNTVATVVAPVTNTVATVVAPVTNTVATVVQPLTQPIVEAPAPVVKPLLHTVVAAVVPVTSNVAPATVATVVQAGAVADPVAESTARLPQSVARPTAAVRSSAPQRVDITPATSGRIVSRTDSSWNATTSQVPLTPIRPDAPAAPVAPLPAPSNSSMGGGGAVLHAIVPTTPSTGDSPSWLISESGSRRFIGAMLAAIERPG